MAPLPPNPISGLLGGSNTPVSPPKPFSAPLGPQTVDSSPMGSLPLTLAPKGKLALPPNPITKSLLAAPPAPSLQLQRHQQNAALLQDIRQQRVAAGKTPAFQPGHSKAEEIAGGIIANVVNPVMWGTGAVQGAKDVKQGVSKIAKGNLEGGAAETGLGALGVAGILPIGKFGKIGELTAEALRARAPEEATAHLLDAAAVAKSQGFGHIPLVVEKGAATPETGGELGKQIREALPGAPDIRKAQKAGYSTVRSQRVAAAAEAGLQAGGGTAGHIAAKAHLANALPREFFGALTHFTPAQVDEAHRFIDASPLQFFQKVQARDAISNAVHGVVPTESEQALLERAFGKVALPAGERAKTSTSFWDKFVSYTNIPRAVRSSADVSAALRQGLVVLVTHPGVWSRAFAKSLKSFGSEGYYQASQEAILKDPLYPLLEKWKVPFTDIGPKNVANTEEAFIGGQAAEHLHELPGIKGTPVATLLRPASNIIRRSDRAFTGFQNEARFEMAKMLAEKASLLGHDLNGPDLGPSIGKVVGTFTGRGVTPKILSGHLTTMNALMFSPRLMAARLNLLSPVYYAKLDPFARAEAMRGARNLVASIGTVMFVAKMLGANVNFDPRSSNFTKIKVGNTRIDIAGGFSQYIRFIAQEMTREAISSSGHKSHIGWGQHDISDLSNLTKLGRSKSAPIPGFLWDEGSGKDFVGRPISQTHELWSNAPFVAQDTLDAQQLGGPKTAIVDGFLSAIGLGVQTYKDKAPKSTGNSSLWGGGSGGGSDWAGGNGGSSSSLWSSP